jgi:outer membrane protein OmpA-like peptidoglycan-associated protein
MLDDVIEDKLKTHAPGFYKATKLGTRGAALVLKGSENHLPVIAALSGAKAIGKGLGVNFFVSFGWIWGDDAIVQKDYTRPLTERQAHLVLERKSEVHFPLGVAVLTRAARARLRELCAAELPWFSFEGSSLVVTGNCDRIDTPEHNYTLSVMRAQNVVQAMKDILGRHFCIPSNSVRTIGKGETEASAVKNEPQINPNRRRVDIDLNGRRVLTLWGA